MKTQTEQLKNLVSFLNERNKNILMDKAYKLMMEQHFNIIIIEDTK